MSVDFVFLATKGEEEVLLVLLLTVASCTESLSLRVVWTNALGFLAAGWLAMSIELSLDEFLELESSDEADFFLPGRPLPAVVGRAWVGTNVGGLFVGVSFKQILSDFAEA